MCETDHCSLSQADLYLKFTDRLRSHTNFLQRLSLHLNRMTRTIIISSKRNPPVVFFQWCSKWKFLLQKFCLNYDVFDRCYANSKFTWYIKHLWFKNRFRLKERQVLILDNIAKYINQYRIKFWNGVVLNIDIVFPNLTIHAVKYSRKRVLRIRLFIIQTIKCFLGWSTWIMKVATLHSAKHQINELT